MSESAGFKLNERRGFWLTFKNGWTISVQWGPGTYGSNYDEPFEGRHDRAYAADEAEVWAWNEAGEHYPGDPLGYQTPDQVARLIKKIKGKPRAKVAAS